MELILLMTSLLIFTSYLIFVYEVEGILPSISASFYAIKNKSLFIFWTWGSAIPLMIVGEHGLAFFSGAFLCLVGAASDYRNENLTMNVHSIGAKGAIILGYVYLTLILSLWWLVVPSVAGIVYMYKKDIKNSVWWIEVVAYYTFWIGYLINFLR